MCSACAVIRAPVAVAVGSKRGDAIVTECQMEFGKVHRVVRLQFWALRRCHSGSGFCLGRSVQYLYGMASLYDQDAAIHVCVSIGELEADVEHWTDQKNCLGLLRSLLGLTRMWEHGRLCADRFVLFTKRRWSVEMGTTGLVLAISAQTAAGLATRQIPCLVR